MMMKLKLLGYVGVGVLVLLGIFYLYFKYSQSQIAALTKTVTEQAVAIKGFEDTMKALKEDADRIALDQRALGEKVAEIRTETERQKALLRTRQIRNLGALRPTELEAAINAESEALMKKLEEMTRVRPAQ